MGKHDSLIRRMCADGMLTGLFVVLTLVNIKLGPMVRISFGSLPVVFASLLLGPLDGFLVALLGEFICQTVNYGFSLTTPLWVLVPGIRALVIGFVSSLYKKKGKALERHPLPYFSTLIVAALMVTCFNTLVSFLDALIFDYSFSIVWITTLIRFGISLATAIVIGFICIPLTKSIGSLVFPGSKDRYK
jgi:ECF transporter S component (folate family)